MNEGLLTSELKGLLENIVSHCFYSNRIIDRICSIMSVRFVMSNTSNMIHHKLAHLYPLLADKISDYMDSRDCTTIYGATIAGDQEYEDYIECFRTMLELNLDLESRVKDTIVVAEKSGDYSTKVYLENFLLELIPITKDIMLLTDKAEMYGDSDLNAMKFDHDIYTFNVFGE